ncbi:hypothetical protein [Streptomyces lanatus]|uniref:hypothetical protein n=1 Tax=Streptomyces lanatus TaxID=66900 RepID=UPI00167DF4AE|nr:hypothetical protein [Streptomyces lanatus]
MITSPWAGGVREDSALDGGMQSAGDVGYDHAQVGAEYWAGLPLPWNASGQDLEITRAEFVDCSTIIRLGPPIKYKS